MSGTIRCGVVDMERVYRKEEMWGEGVHALGVGGRECKGRRRECVMRASVSAKERERARARASEQAREILERERARERQRQRQPARERERERERREEGEKRVLQVCICLFQARTVARPRL